MIAALNANKNIIACVALVLLGVTIVFGSIRIGVKMERNKNAAETAATNTIIAEDRGKDEAEIAAAETAAKSTDAAVKGALKQTLILDEETARLLSSVGEK
jgi:hypothetical protein